MNIVACSALYRTPPHSGAGMMPGFYNAVAAIRADYASGSILRLLKILERQAGRRPSPRWSRRPLDLDLLDHGRRVMNWPASNRAGGPIILPHPLLHRRGFVLVPLAEIAPHWRHPVLGVAAADLLRREPGLRRGIIQVGSPLV
jgi:2-amino-4-hydroxy-6-hydroxymethyldihydropteridine diphosphokinase